MATLDAGTTDVATAGTRVQISSSSSQLKAITVKGRIGNTGNVYFGVSDVSATDGWELQPGEAFTLDFGEGSIPWSTFWVDAATNGDDVDWWVIRV